MDGVRTGERVGVRVSEGVYVRVSEGVCLRVGERLGTGDANRTRRRGEGGGCE